MKITDTNRKKIKYYYINIKNTPTEMVSAIKQFVSSYPDNADIGITAGSKTQIEILQVALTDFTRNKAAAIFSHLEPVKHSRHTVLVSIDNTSRDEILPVLRSVLKHTAQNVILLCNYSYWWDKTDYFKKAKEIVPQWRETHPPIPKNPNFCYIEPKEIIKIESIEKKVVIPDEDIILPNENNKKNVNKFNLLEFIGNTPEYIIAISGILLIIVMASFYWILPSLYFIANIFGIIISEFLKWFK